MKKKKPAKKTSSVGTVVNTSEESIHNFLFRKLKTTKFILISERLSTGGRSYMEILTDEKFYRSGFDYIGMMEAAKHQILNRRKEGLPE